MEIPILDGFWTNESSKTNGWWILFFTSETSPDPCEFWWAVVPNNEQISNKEGGVEHQAVPHLFFLAVGPSWFTNFGFSRTPGECVLIHVRSAKLQTSTRVHVYLKRKGWYCWWFRNPANQLRLEVYPIIYRVLYIPGGAAFLPSTVVPKLQSAANDSKLKNLKVEQKANCLVFEGPWFFLRHPKTLWYWES